MRLSRSTASIPKVMEIWWLWRLLEAGEPTQEFIVPISYCPVVLSLCETLTQSDAQHAHLLQCWTCVSRDGFLQTLDTMIGATVSFQLSPTITSLFGPYHCHSLNIFLFSLDHSQKTLNMVVCKSPSRSKVFEIFRPAHLGP